MPNNHDLATEQWIAWRWGSSDPKWGQPLWHVYAASDSGIIEYYAAVYDDSVREVDMPRGDGELLAQWMNVASDYRSWLLRRELVIGAQ